MMLVGYVGTQFREAERCVNSCWLRTSKACLPLNRLVLAVETSVAAATATVLAVKVDPLMTSKQAVTAAVLVATARNPPPQSLARLASAHPTAIYKACSFCKLQSG